MTQLSHCVSPRIVVATTEHTINDALAGLLRLTRHAWRARGVILRENTAILAGTDRRPDILILEPNVSPVVVETEVMPAATVEKDARDRLGHELRGTRRAIRAAVAVRLPSRLRGLAGQALAHEIRRAEDLEFALFTGTGHADAERWPQDGWLTGGVGDLSVLAELASVPPSAVEQAADDLAGGIAAAVARLDELAAVAPKIARTLHQADSEQTRRMAMTIVAGAFVFHESLVGRGGRLATLRSVDRLRARSQRLTRAAVLAEWAKILEVNDWPIFDIAGRIVEVLPAGASPEILGVLAETATRLLRDPSARSHDLTGTVFQKLITDRRSLAAFYTMPSSAALLVGLALPSKTMPGGGSWDDAGRIEGLRVADFACGTGALLSAVYRRVARLYELEGGDAAALHGKMMSDVLVGCDVLPAAVHLTATVLSSVHPSTRDDRTSILTVPYGVQPDGTVALGSLDLLSAQGSFAKAAGGRSEPQAETWRALPHAAFDLVVMNPPYARATGQEAAKIGVPVPMFAALGNLEAEQRAMSKAVAKLSEGTCAHGNAGEASYFLALVDRKLKPGGRLALVMPLSLLAGEAWEKARALLRKRYDRLIVVTIVGACDDDTSFSADTGMAECLVVATKRGEALGAVKPRAGFVVLKQRPGHHLEAVEIARAVHRAIVSQTSRRVEDGPLGGSEIRVGADLLGSMIDAPLPSTGPWPLSRIADFSVAQTAHELVANSRLWLPGEREASTALPIVRLRSFADAGPYHMDINGTEQAGGAVRGPFEVVDRKPGAAPTYPILWGHRAEQERAIVVECDKEGELRAGRRRSEDEIVLERAAAISRTASKVHLNRDFRFNSQSTAVAWTHEPSIGGRAWPSVVFRRETSAYARAFALWSNSTLGLLLYWWVANKQQAGRGSVTITAIPELPTLDFQELSSSQRGAFDAIFEDMQLTTFAPFHEIDADDNRHALDRRILVEVFGLEGALVGPSGALHRFRQKLAQEPSIKGGK